MTAALAPNNVVLLGSTGSIGRNAVVELLEHRDEYKVVGLVARNNIDLLAQQASELGANTVHTPTIARTIAITTDFIFEDNFISSFLL